ncbi:MAG: TlyA family RNA methyltransferase [Thermotogae bacterium]|nr:TlyA family RNA methyltransferase [Thermotogota bacterium]
MKKERLDLLLVKRGFFPLLKEAQAEIMLGNVIAGDKKISKCGALCPVDIDIRLINRRKRYVGRGGFKIEKAVKDFNIIVRNQHVIDMGASTGGFTDFFLQNGAERVFAIDVGYGELAWKLRKDPRVCVMERQNVRYVEERDTGGKADIISCDLAFISVKNVLPTIKKLLKPEGVAIVLVKPQFELSGNKTEKGIVHSKKFHKQALIYVKKYVINNGLKCANLTYSPIKGKKGNIEFFYLLSFTGTDIPEHFISDVVDKAHEFFKDR